MNEKELKMILAEGEGLKVEFKERFDSKNLAKEIVAFANTEGGRIFLGVSDEGEIKGTEITNRLKSQIQDIARNCEPSIKISFEEVGKVLVIAVFEGENKPYQCSLGFYLREGPNSQKLSRDEILNFVTGVGKIKFDEQINENFKFPEDFDEDRFEKFLKKSNITNKNILDVLINLSLAVKKGNEIIFNNAGILLFGKNIERFVKQNFVYCTLFKGNERVDIIDRKEFKEDLLTNYFEALNFLKKHLKLSYILEGSGPRKEVLELPEEALKEALINSLIHRDYFETGFGVNVEIFDDRVEITNWGKLLFDRKELGKISIPRNPILFDLFHRLNMIEKAGSGINRIKRLIKEMNLKVRFESSDFFRVIFMRHLDDESTPQVTPQVTPQAELTELEKKVFLEIRNNPKISRNNLSKRLGIGEDTVKEYLRKLREKGILRRIGETSAGYWEVKEKDGKK